MSTPSSVPSAPTYRIRIGTDYGPLQEKEGLSKTELYDRVMSWLKDDRAMTLMIETTHG